MSWEDIGPVKDSEGWEDVTDKQGKPTLLQNIAGGAMGVADLIGMSPGAVAGTALAVGDVMRGQDPRLALGAAHAVAEGMNPMDKIVPSAELYRQTPGYDAVAGTAAKVLDAVSGAAGNVAGWGRLGAGRLLGEDQATTFQKAEELDAAARLGAEAGLAFLRGRPAKAGTAAGYREVATQKPTDTQLRQSEEARKTYPEGGWQDIGKVDTTKYNQMDLPFEREPSAIPPEVRSPYNLKPEEIARLEQELNPPTEQRVTGQGELFTGERALTPDEAIQRRFLMEEPTTGARDRIMTPEAERLTMDTPARVGEFEGRMGPPDQALGAMEGQRALPFRNTDDVGGMGEAALSGRERRGAEQTRANISRNQLDQDPIPYRPIGPKSQRGVIDPDLLTFGVSRMLSEKGPRETIKKFMGTFNNSALATALSNVRDPKSTSTLVWMSPDDFHKLANVRIGYEEISPNLRKDIQQGLKTKEGLHDIPYLEISDDGKVRRHEGRHRMDVFKEQGIDLVPVRLIANNIKWGETTTAERPKQLFAEARAADPSFSIPLPSLLRDQFKQQDILAKHGPGFKQRGAWTPFESTKKERESIMSRHRPMASQTGAIRLFGDGAKKEGAAKTFAELKKLYTYDKRPLAQLVEEEDIKPETMTDLASKDQTLAARLDRMLQKGMSNVLIDRTMAILSQDKGPVGKLIKWVVDNQTNINTKMKVLVEENIEAALAPWKKVKRANPNEIREMLDVWLPRIGKEALTPEDFKTARQFEVYQAVHGVLKEGWERVNEARQKAGLRPISFIENYFPAIREGDYVINVIDKTGELKWSSAYKTVYAAEWAKKALQKEFGDEFTVKDVQLRKKSEYDLHSFTAFEETMRAMSKEDPIKTAIQKRYAELVAKRGFGKTGIMRKDIEGALGFERGERGVRNAEQVLESYIKRQESYLANLERAQLQKQLAELPKELWDKAPLAREYIRSYLDKSRGADLDQLTMLRDITEDLSTMAGFGRNAPREFIQNLSSFASLMWLATPRFLLTQLAQPLAAMPKLVEVFQAGDKTVNPATAWFNGWVETFTPDAMSKEARAWAKKQGYLESTIVQLLEMKLSDVRGEKWRAVGEAMRWAMGKTEQLAVRTPVFHMFEKQLREQVPNKKERFEMAANLMDYYMVHYDRESSPLVYDKAGLVGEAARPLKQYAHNAWGQFFEYAQTAKDKKNLAPLATHIGMQALVGGMKGIILVAEATVIITLINNMFGTDIPTPEQLMLESKIPDALIFGGYSTALGRDLSGSLAAPSMPNMFSLAPLDFSYTAIKDMGKYLIKSVKGTATDQDAMAAMLAVSPNAMRGWIEGLYSEPGKPIPKPGDKMRGEYPAPYPDEPAKGTLTGILPETAVRFGMGLKSIDEAKVNMAVRATKQLLMRDVERRASALDAIADRVINKEEIPTELIESYIEQGGDPSRLAQNLKQRIIERELTWEQRNTIQRPSPGQIRKLDQMKRMLDEENPIAEKMSGKTKKKQDMTDEEFWALWKPDQPAAMAWFRELRAQARHMFPNDLEKQKKWIEYQKDSVMRQESEIETFKHRMKQRREQNNYQEM